MAVNDAAKKNIRRASASTKLVAVKKKPGAWHEGHDIVPAKRGEVRPHHDDEDMPDGEVDTRSTTRGQRYTFVKNKTMFDPAMVKRFEFLMNPENRQKGKQAEINAIVNSCVARTAQNGSGVLVKAGTVAMVQSHYIKDEDIQAMDGLGWYSMVGQQYSGNEALAQKAVDAGELLYNEKNKKWYVSKHTVKKSNIHEKGHTSKRSMDAANDQDFLEALCHAEETIDADTLSLGWLQAKAPTKKKENKQFDGQKADDGDFTVMQEHSFFSKTFGSRVSRLWVLGLRDGEPGISRPAFLVEVSCGRAPTVQWRSHVRIRICLQGTLASLMHLPLLFPVFLVV